MMFVALGPVPPYERRTYNGLSGQDTVRAGTFWGVLSNVSLRDPWYIVRHP